MRQKFVILIFSLILLFPLVGVSASPGNTELVIENIRIEPENPQIGELVSITADVYNSGIFETNSVTSIITAAYFVDEDLLYVDEIGNVKPGLSNKIQISSIPIWNVESGTHTIKIILDYHNTLVDDNDSPDDNIIEKTLDIDDSNELKLSLTTSPEYIIQNKDVLFEITLFVEDADSGKPLNNKQVLIKFDDDEIPLITNTSGMVTFSKMINSSESLGVEAYFSGDDAYLPSSSSLEIYSISNNNIPGIMMKVTDIYNQKNFADNLFEFIIFQDDYDNLFKKIFPDSTFYDSNSFWVSLPPDHEYFTEVYLDGRFISLTEKVSLQENTVVVEEILLPEPAEIRFRVIDELGEPQQNAVVNNWIYSGITNENGFTDWIKVLPTINDNPYDVEIVLSDKKIIQNHQILVFSDERKTIDVVIMNSTTEIPDWIRTTAGWWANQQIDDKSFIKGLQFLIKEDIIKIPLTSQNANSTTEIPDWIRTTAGWWANQQIDDKSFIEGLQFLIKNGILKIQ